MPNKKAPKGRDLKKAKKAKASFAKSQHKKIMKLQANKPSSVPVPSVKPVKAAKRQSTATLMRDGSKRVLLVGEGNFSFARSLVRLAKIGGVEPKQGANLTATGYDPEDVVRVKYPDASAILEELDGAHVRVLHGVDATDLGRRIKVGEGKKGTGPATRAKQFDRIVFNFPHVGKGIKDEAHNVSENQLLIIGFFRAAVPLLRPRGEIHVTLKKGKPYDLWNLRGLGTKLTQNVMAYETAEHFDADSFPGYAHRRTIGFKDGVSSADNEDIQGKVCLTHVWRMKAA